MILGKLFLSKKQIYIYIYTNGSFLIRIEIFVSPLIIIQVTKGFTVLTENKYFKDKVTSGLLYGLFP